MQEFRIYEVEARHASQPGTWLNVRVIATEYEQALAAAKPLAAKFFGSPEAEISVHVGTPAYKVDALVGLTEYPDVPLGEFRMDGTRNEGEERVG